MPVGERRPDDRPRGRRKHLHRSLRVTHWETRLGRGRDRSRLFYSTNGFAGLSTI